MKHVEDVYQLSPMQEGILFHAVYSQEPGIYFEQIRATFQADLDVKAFQSAWQKVVDRHTILRSAFMWEGLDKPLQVVRQSVALPWEQLDWRTMSKEEQAGNLNTFLEADRQKGFKLEQAPLMRCALIRVAEDRYVVVWSHHHILLDGWCSAIIVKEAFAIYASLVLGREVALPPPRPYRDYIAWLTKQDLAKAQTFWAAQLQGFESPTPTRVEKRGQAKMAREGRPAPAVCREYRHSLSVEFSDRLRAAARRQHLTLNTLVQGAWGVLLSRYSGEQDVVFGVAVSGRPVDLPGVESMVGLFVNTLPVRIQFSGTTTLEHWLDELQRRQVEREQYAYTPLVEIQNGSGVPSGTPLFDTLLAFENYPVDRTGTAAAAGIRILETDVSLEETNYPLVIQINPEDQLGFRVLYDATRFEEPTVAGMVKHLANVLQEIIADPLRKVAEVSLMSNDDRNRLQAEWNAVDVGAYLEPDCVQVLFEKQAALTPDHVAATFGAETLTYRQLNERANQLGHTLRGIGVGPDVVVGICVERSLDLVVGVLGILKAGGAYLPLDPAYPRARLELMIEDAKVPVLLTQNKLRADLPVTGARIMALDAEAAALAEGVRTNPICVAGPRNLAYVIYTSGSTGKPKGSLVTHQNVTRLFKATEAWFHFDDRDVWTLFHSFAFDFSVWEIWGALLYGGRLVIVPYLVSRSPDEFRKLLAEERVTVLNQTPSAFYQLIGADRREAGATHALALRVVVFGGEALDFAMLAPWFEKYGDSRPQLVNMYGITETTVHVTWRPLCRQDATAARSLIGIPIPDLRIVLLDWCGQPVPKGVPGEMYVGGAGVARGYLNRPELTAERFLPCPLTGDPRDMVYRTGDLARRLAGHDIEYMGRIDQQIKIRGFRIEPGEIEAALGSHPGVKSCVVIADKREGSDDIRLMAYLVPHANYVPLPEAGTVDAEGPPSQLVSQWQRVFQDAYARTEADPSLTFNTSGWNSSYTGEPIPAAEMKEWVERTVERIRTLPHRRVLEIGCGTGLLLSRLAPGCETYVGSDFSATALGHVRRILQSTAELGHVKLLHRSADDFSEIPSGAFDLVILNSVVQYFPGIDYLVDVLEKAVAAVTDGGAIFVGDVRNYRLLKAAHASFEIARGGDRVPARVFRERIERRMRLDEELVIESGFFQALKDRLARIGYVQTLVKRARHHNEMSRFRYDAVLGIGNVSSPVALTWQEWPQGVAGLAACRECLGANRAAVVAFRNIPDARCWADHNLVEKIATDPDAGSPVADMRRQLAAKDSLAVDPEQLWEMGQALGYGVAIAVSNMAGCCDAVFWRQEGGAGNAGCAICTSAGREQPKPWPSYATNPQWRTVARRLAPIIRRHAQQTLPAHMVPSTFAIIDEIPLGPTGKVDRRALPRGEAALIPGAEAGRAPETPTEELLAGIWMEVLGVPEMSADRNFFDLGGHSLLATQVISRVRAAFGADIPLRALFEKPTVSELAAEIDRVRKEACRMPPPIEVVPRTPPPPLSFGQQRLWFLDQMEGHSPMYNMPCAFRLEGSFAVPAFQRALSELVNRHEILRTSFHSVDGVPFQVIGPARPVTVRNLDLQALPPPERESAWQHVAAAEAAEPFDLAAGPLLRVVLLKLEAQMHVVVMTLHHIVSDGWSMGVWIREFAELYTAFVAHPAAASPLKPLPVQYADYAVWQRQWLTGDVLDAQMEYWTKQLAGAPAVLDLPTDTPRTAERSFRGGLYAFRIPEDDARALKDLSRYYGVTLFMTMLSGFAALLSRCGGGDDLAIGSPIANRNHKAIEPLIGFFVNTLVLRLDLAGDPTCAELLKRTRRVALDAYTHQDVPFELLVERLQPARNLAHTPLFQVMFVMQNTPAVSYDLPGLTVTALRAQQTTTKFDLTLSLEEASDGLAGEIEYNSDLFESATIAKMAERYHRLVAGMARNPRGRLSDLPLLSERERNEIVVAWNRTATPDRRTAGVTDLFEEWAAAAPDAVAAVSPRERVTYGELNRRSNQLAHHLLAEGVGPEIRVGLCVERSVDMLVGVLGILKAGGAYVPVDPAYPRARVANMIEDSGVKLVIATGATAASLPATTATLLRLDAMADTLARGPIGNPASKAGPANPAYVIYTSGSTGVPKGVMVTRRGLSNLALSQRRLFNVSPDSRFLQLVSLSFDVAASDIFTALCAGASLCLLDAESLLPGPDLVNAMAENSVTHIELPPSVLAALPYQPLPMLKAIVAGGEVARPDVLAKWGNGRTIYNAYGPTEATVCATVSRMADERPSIIGTPIDNVRIHILDRHMQPVPAGVPGQIHIGGAGVARGYLNRPDLTASSFVPDPFATTPGERLYATGDRGRYLADGRVEFLGRKDDQVKIRGFRVELGEIESVMNRHAAVRQAAVCVRDPECDTAWLVAFVVMRDGQAGSGQDIRPFLGEHLPAHMVPARIIAIDGMPLMHNGKVDRKALAALNIQDGKSDDPTRHMPGTEAEKAIAAIFMEILRCGPPGVEDSFFDLGGHSLSATQVISKIRDRLGIEIPIKTLFAEPTVAGLAEAVEMRKERGGEGAVPGITRIDRQKRVHRTS